MICDETDYASHLNALSFSLSLSVSPFAFNILDYTNVDIFISFSVCELIYKL